MISILETEEMHKELYQQLKGHKAQVDLTLGVLPYLV